MEPWAAQLLALLNTEIREPQANRYITPALDELQEIQRTGDIFFPGDWLYCLLSGHKSEGGQTAGAQLDCRPPRLPRRPDEQAERECLLSAACSE